MGNMTSKTMKLGLVGLTVTSMTFYFVIWCYTTTTQGYAFTMLVEKATKSKFLGDIAGIYILYSFPIVLSAIFATAYLAVQQRHPARSSSSPSGRFWRLLWTRPLIVNKIVGILNGFDVALIAATTFIVVWMFLNEYVPQARAFHGQPAETLLKWKHAAVVLGRVSVLPISLLFVPVSRSSPMLRMMDIPFEQAVKYHTWLGHLTMTILSGHVGIFIGIFAYKQNMAKLIAWPFSGISYLAGLIAFVAGCIMWVTATSYVRRHKFNLFYYAHQLYWVFFAFFAYHVGVKTTGYCMGSVFLYFLDRFFRLLQSRQKMFISSAKILPNDVVELKIPRAPDLKHSALSFLFINVPCISHEWHPFSVASSPLDESSDITIYIKPYGVSSWTQRLHTMITRSVKNADSRCPFAAKLSMEGPYGHETDYFLRYKTLVLVAGGIGITPFLAMISDILHRYRLEQTDLPRHVHLVWVVQSQKDCQILKQLSPASVFPQIQSSDLSIRVDVYVTRGEIVRGWFPDMPSSVRVGCVSGNASAAPSASLSIGNNCWMLVFIASTWGATIAIFGALQQYFVETPRFEFGSRIAQWVHVSLLLASVALGILGVGGGLFACWYAHVYLKGRNLAKTNTTVDGTMRSQVNTLYGAHHFPRCDDVELGTRTLLHAAYTATHKGRPCFAEILSATARDYSNEDVGVLVSGPEGLLLDVANECRSQPSNDYQRAHIFNFHSVSFEL